MGFSGRTRGELQLATLEQACEAGDLWACLNQARLIGSAPFLLESSGEDPAPLYARVCASETSLAAEACRELGLVLAHTDPEGAADAFRAACRGDDTQSCRVLGQLHESGELDASDLHTAGLYYEAACLRGDRAGCAGMLSLIEAGSFESRAYTTIYAALERTCEVGDGEACAKQGLALSSGEGVARDEQRAAASFERACKRGDGLGCYHRARALERAPFATRETREAKRLYEYACEHEISEACGRAEIMAAEVREKLELGIYREKIRLPSGPCPPL